MVGQGWPPSHETDAARNQNDPGPAQRTDLLMQRKTRYQRQQHVSQRSGRQHIGQIGPGQGVHVGSKEGKQEKNSDGDPRIEYRD